MIVKHGSSIKKKFQSFIQKRLKDGHNHDLGVDKRHKHQSQQTKSRYQNERGARKARNHQRDDCLTYI